MHQVICRASAAPGACLIDFVTLSQTGTEDGLQWGKIDIPNWKLETHVDALLERIAGLDPAEIPDVTICTRSQAEVEAEAPLTAQYYGRLLDTQPGVSSLSILCPIRFEAPQRTKHEMWSSVWRVADQIVCNERVFRRSVLANEIKRFFDAGDDRPPWSPTTFKEWAGQTTMRSELWLRPGWQIATAEFMPGAFPLPESRLPVNPEAIAAKKDRENFHQRKEKVARMWKSRGFRYSEKTRSWAPPKA